MTDVRRAGVSRLEGEAGTVGSEGVAASDAAETGDVARALRRLLPALERYEAGHAAASFPAYRPGAIASEASGLPDEGVGIDATIDELCVAVEHGCRISAPGFVGFVTTGASTMGAVAQTASAVAGSQRYLLHAFNTLESTGLRWLAELCGLPEGVHGVFTSGGSTAQLLAIGAGRQWAFEQRGVDLASDGFPAGVTGRIYVSDRGHRTIHRAAAVLGIGRNAVVDLPSDRCGRLDVAALDARMTEDAARGIVPLAVVAVAGTTDTGAVDPIADVVEVARRHGSWVHVDGAYGLVANASERFATAFEGVRDADSWIVDPHKWLATGVGVGAAFVRDGDLLTRAFAEGEAAYLEGSFSHRELAADASQFDSMGGPWADQSLELSSPPRGALVWAVLREIGRAGVVARVGRHADFAGTIAQRARDDDRLELLCDAQLSIVCFRYAPPAGADPDAFTERLLERLRRQTPFVPTSTRIEGALAIRPCFINPRTTRREVDGLLDAVLRIGDDLMRRGGDGLA